jgi:hypothetical protein
MFFGIKIQYIQYLRVSTAPCAQECFVTIIPVEESEGRIICSGKHGMVFPEVYQMAVKIE